MRKASNRNLLEEKEYLTILNQLERIGIKINNYINAIGKHKLQNEKQIMTTNDHQ